MMADDGHNFILLFIPFFSYPTDLLTSIVIFIAHSVETDDHLNEGDGLPITHMKVLVSWSLPTSTVEFHPETEEGGFGEEEKELANITDQVTVARWTMHLMNN